MDEESLIEQLTSAHRERNARGEVQFARAFHDLEPDARLRGYAETLRQRRLEAALDPEGLSSTARAVLRRISGA